MRWKRRDDSVWTVRLLLCAAFLATHCWILAPQAKAQTEPEYKMEVGAGAGLMNYLGDFNGSLLSAKTKSL